MVLDQDCHAVCDMYTLKLETIVDMKDALARSKIMILNKIPKNYIYLILIFVYHCYVINLYVFQNYIILILIPLAVQSIYTNTLCKHRAIAF